MQVSIVKGYTAHEKAVNGVVSLCGNCRQMLFEYAPDIRVILNDERGNMIKTGIKELLPLPYIRIIC